MGKVVTTGNIPRSISTLKTFTKYLRSAVVAGIALTGNKFAPEISYLLESKSEDTNTSIQSTATGSSDLVQG